MFMNDAMNEIGCDYKTGKGKLDIDAYKNYLEETEPDYFAHMYSKDFDFEWYFARRVYYDIVDY